MATVRPSALHGRHRALAADFARWVAQRCQWLRPRTVPLLAALLGLLVTLGAVKYVAVYALGSNLALEMHARMTRGNPPCAPECRYPGSAHPARAPGR